ncbi:hypothetical protein K469DRAFT_608735, partial [Zopfia rhizophila CBS 207.26]
GVYQSQDSLVRGAIEAGVKKQHLVLRPEDAWFTILTQLSFYMRKNWDHQNVSDKWDNLPGLSPPPGILDFALYQMLDLWMNEVFKQRNKTDWLLDWVLPGFQTVPSAPLGMQKSADEMMAMALMMTSPTPSLATMGDITCECGFPSVTLLGTQAVWKKLLDKLDRLGEFGSEADQYSRNLRPILSRFVVSFERPNDLSIRRFWNDMVMSTSKQKLCKKTSVVTGWINGFHYWDGAGNLLRDDWSTPGDPVVLDNITYPFRRIQDLPNAYNRLLICIASDTPEMMNAEIIVGLLATSVKKRTPKDYTTALKQADFKLPDASAESSHGMVQAVPVWIAYGDRKVIQVSVPFLSL